MTAHNHGGTKTKLTALVKEESISNEIIIKSLKQQFSTSCINRELECSAIAFCLYITAMQVKIVPTLGWCVPAADQERGNSVD